MARRLVRWFTFNIAFALLPLGAAVLIRSLAGKLTREALANSPEILFFALMISATAVGDLVAVSKPEDNGTVFQILWSALLLGAVSAALLYGVFLYASIMNPAASDFRVGLWSISKWLAVTFAIVSTLAEAWIGHMEASQ